MSAIDSIVTRLLSLHPKLIDLSLDRVWRLLAAIGHPERNLPPVIHVAGTNGKGSTIAFMRAILEAAGLRVHVYTSPHLVRFNERFRLGQAGEGVLVSDDELASVFEECERANAGEPITVFEITTAAGLLLFARHPADVLLLEVGLGGRLDATNVVDRPLATVVTPVSFDHSDYLGDSIAKIAAEKAGIFKRDVPAIVAAQPREALMVIERAAAHARAPIRIAGENWTATEERGRLVYQDDAGLLDLPAPRLPGGISSRMRASPSRPCVRFRHSRFVRRFSKRSRKRIGRRACSGCPKASCPGCFLREASCGSMAATTRTAAAPWPMRSPISRSGCRVRWC